MTFAPWMLACLLAAAATPQGQLPGMPQAAPRSALVVGQVIDAGTGRPVSGALVEVRVEASLAVPPAPFSMQAASAQPAQAPRVLTGSDGSFVFRRTAEGPLHPHRRQTWLPPGRVWPPASSGLSQMLTLFDGQKAGGLRIYICGDTQPISGVVIDEAGEPVVGIQLRAVSHARLTGQRRFVYAAELRGPTTAAFTESMACSPATTSLAAVSTKVSVPASTAEDVRRSSACRLYWGNRRGDRNRPRHVDSSGRRPPDARAIGDWTSRHRTMVISSSTRRHFIRTRQTRFARRSSPSDPARSAAESIFNCASGDQTRLWHAGRQRWPNRRNSRSGHRGRRRRHAARAGNRHDGYDRAGSICFPCRTCWPLLDPRGEGCETSRRSGGNINRYHDRERDDLVSRMANAQLLRGPIDCALVDLASCRRSR